MQTKQLTTVWLEAELFDDCGGWCNDSQFLESVGAPYLLAAGVGKPVADAITQVEIDHSARYKLWVRCKDWYSSHSPGQFQVLVNGQASDTLFGNSDNDQWRWVEGGEFDLTAGAVEIRLHDLTGWWGRCDAIVLTDDSTFTPNNDQETLRVQREEFGGISSESRDVGCFDVVVVGGGLAGTSAAVAAARHGARVALVQDRPVLGGNGSTEIQVPVQGDLTYEPWDPRETGLIEEFDPRTVGKGPWSANLERLALAEKNLELWMNVRLTGVEMANGERGNIEGADDQKIQAITALNTVTGERIRMEANLFIDCSGDSWLGYWAGADYRHGQEAQSEHNEPIAPDKPDGRTQSSSLNSGRFKGHDRPIEFETLPWAYRWNTPEDFESVSMGAVWNNGFRVSSFDDVSQGKGRLPQNARAPIHEWYVEFGGRYDTIQDAEWIRDELFRINMGIWDYVKNRHPEYKQKNACRELIWLNFVVGKRESRRLLGEYILDQNDIIENTLHDDTVAYAGWVMDIHHPCGFFTAGPQAHLEYLGRLSIPYRCLVSRNVGNLMMAGRNISVTHLALAKTRVMRTCALTGWAAGVGAALAIRNSISPRVVGQEYLHELQQTLLKEGAYLPGVRNEDRNDLATCATVTASSCATIRDPKYLVTLSQYFWNAKHPLDTGLAVQFKASHEEINSVALFMRSTRDVPTPIQLTLSSSRWPGDLEAMGELATVEAVVPANSEGWVEFPLRAATTLGDWHVLSLPATPGLMWDLYKYHPPETWRGYETSPGWSCEWGCHMFRLEPGGEPAASKQIAEHGMQIEFKPQNLLNGVSRVVEGHPNSWAPDPAAPLPQWIELALDEAKPLNELHVSFQMDIMAPRGYSAEAWIESEWKTLFRETSNRQRRRVHHFDSVETSRVRLVLEERSAATEVPLTPVCQIRLYNKSKS